MRKTAPPVLYNAKTALQSHTVCTIYIVWSPVQLARQEGGWSWRDWSCSETDWHQICLSPSPDRSLPSPRCDPSKESEGGTEDGDTYIHVHMDGWEIEITSYRGCGKRGVYVYGTNPCSQLGPSSLCVFDKPLKTLLVHYLAVLHADERRKTGSKFTTSERTKQKHTRIFTPFVTPFCSWWENFSLFSISLFPPPCHQTSLHTQSNTNAYCIHRTPWVLDLTLTLVEVRNLLNAVLIFSCVVPFISSIRMTDIIVLNTL